MRLAAFAFSTLLKLLPGIQGKVIIFTSFTETQRYLVRTLRTAGLLVAELNSGLVFGSKSNPISCLRLDICINCHNFQRVFDKNLQPRYFSTVYFTSYR